MLDEQAVGGHVVAVDQEAGIGGVSRPADAIAVIGPPRPDVVEDHVVAVDHKRRGRLARRRSANPEEDVVQRCRIGGFIVASGMTVANLQ